MSAIKQKKIGLALGSGGTRGFAHIGVLKVLISENIPIDFLVGSSAGAVIAAYFAVHGEIESFENLVIKMKKIDFVSLIDFISPKKALIRGTKIQKFIDKLFMYKDFSQVKIPLKIVATDLRRGKEVILTKGNIAQAVLASGTLPGVFPPVSLGKELLVDGGVVNPTPVDVVRKMGAEIILGVDLTMKGKVNLNNPNIVEVLVRSFDVLRTETTKLTVGKFDKNLVIIKPKISGELNLLDCFNQREEIIKDGEIAAQKILPKIRKLLV
jgi:NTE family protein